MRTDQRSIYSAKRALSRRILIGKALDNALCALANLESFAAGRRPSRHDAVAAIDANTRNNSQAASLAEAFIKSCRVTGIAVHSLGEHIVLKDEESGLLHDLECYRGMSMPQDLPIYKRKALLETLPLERAEEIIEDDARRWLFQRRSFMRSHGRP